MTHAATPPNAGASPFTRALRRTFSTAKTLTASILIGATAVVPSMADDTEIYTGLNSGSGAIDPNILFIIDTSGSMGAGVTQVIAPYNPATNYTGACLDSRVYWSSSGAVPSCTTSAYFNKSRFRCAAANTPMFGTGASSTGIFQNRVARFSEGSFFFSSSSWTSLSTRAQDPPHVECKADEGTHGAQDFDDPPSGTAVYIQNSSAAYTNSFTNRRNWDSTGSFVTLYSANYMNYYNDSTSTINTTRMGIVKDVVKSIVDSNTNLNIGLMRFDTNSSGDGRNRGGPIIFPFSDIDTGTVRTTFKLQIDALNTTGNTPLAETMLEAARIYRGERAVSGLAPNNIKSVSSAFLADNVTYDTPLDVQCQKNFIIYLTDGEPTSDFEFDSAINTLIANSNLPSGDQTCGGSDNCLDELAEFLNQKDQITGLNGKQNVVTYTIGFFTDQALLSQTGTKGGGSYYLAADFAQLSNAFTQIITEIQAVNTTFTAPAVSVNAFNRVTNRKELFFTLFKPEVEPLWTGNVKRYNLDVQLDANGNAVDSDGDGIPDSPNILDANGDLAVDPQTGFFDIASTSFWTTAEDAPDGDETSKGGAARLLGGTPSSPSADTPSNRTVYTYQGSSTNLSTGTNLVRNNNSQITAAELGLTGAVGEPTREMLLDWLSGVDVRDEDGDGSNTDARRIMHDPLHTKPRLLTYGSSAANPDITLFMATNGGTLHAFDIDDGTEVFTYIPPEHLLRSTEYFVNSTTGGKAYGIDGNISVFFKDDNGNGILETGGGNADRYILVVGERRGGTRYYAIDVTNRSAPKFLWTITGGQGGLPAPDAANPLEFHELGQTWSTATVGKVKLPGCSTNTGPQASTCDVFIFGGGYDPDQDTSGGPRGMDDSGRGIFMVDVFTGNLVWWAGPPTAKLNIPAGCTATLCSPAEVITELDYSIASDLRVIDINGDGYTDRIYFADLGGQLFRLDIDNTLTSPTAGSLAEYFLLADLQKTSAGATPTAVDNRRFYFPPDVSLVIPEDEAPFLSVAIGSGYRAHPLDTTVRDRFYMVMDRNPFATPSLSPKPTALTEANLKDVTTDLDPDLTGFDGWYIQLADFGSSPGSVGTFRGEKVLSPSITFDNKILFTTFEPVSGTSSTSCAPNQGTGKTFVINVTNASPVQDLDTLTQSTSLTRSDRSLTLVRTGIAPEVTILFPPVDGVDPVALVAAEKLNLSLSNPPVKTYWFTQETH